VLRCEEVATAAGSDCIFGVPLCLLVMRTLPGCSVCSICMLALCPWRQSAVCSERRRSVSSSSTACTPAPFHHAWCSFQWTLIVCSLAPIYQYADILQPNFDRVPVLTVTAVWMCTVLYSLVTRSPMRVSCSPRKSSHSDSHCECVSATMEARSQANPEQPTGASW
jgi:hypothetical protein